MGTKRRRKRRKTKLNARVGWVFTIIAVLMFFVYNIISTLNAAVIKTGYVDIGRIVNAGEKKAVLIRKEQTISIPREGYVEYIVSDGERVRAGTHIAEMKSGYDIDDLQENLRLINYKLQQNTDASAQENINSIINKKNVELQALYADLQKRIFSGETEYLASLKEQIVLLNEQKRFLQESTEGTPLTKEELQKEKESLLAQINGSNYFIKTPMTGVVVAYSDGYEDTFTFENRNKITVSEIEKVKDKNLVDVKQKILAGHPIGKVVYNFHYYFACQVEKEDIKHIVSEQPVKIYVEDQEVTAYLEDFHKGNDGKFLGLFRVEDETFRFYEKRCHRIKVEYDDRQGLKIPKSAIFQNENKEEGVYVVDETGTASFRKLKEKLTEDNEYVVCRYSPRDLKKNDEVNLYDRIVLNPSSVKEGQKVR